MEAVPATTGARRTVRLAAALVAGQVVLVAVIGWVTLSRAGSRPRGVDQLAAPPARVPPAVVRPGPPTTTAPTTTTRPARTAGPVRSGQSAHRPRRGTRPAAASSVPGATPPAPAATPPAPPVTKSSGPVALVPPSSVTTTPSPAVTPSPAPSATGGPVRAGGRCAEIFVVARADDGRTVACLPSPDHQLRWKIV